MRTPTHLRYSTDHEWVELVGATASIGITDHAASALGDIVYVELPRIGDEVNVATRFGEIESTKSVSDLYSPVSGTVVEVNSEAQKDPSLVNRDPYGEGWLLRVTADRLQEGLMDAAAYQTFVA